MDNFYLSALVRELTPEVQGRTVVRITPVATTLVIDLRLTADRQLLAMLDRSTPAVYLSNGTGTQSLTRKPASTFLISLLRKHVVGARIVRLWKEPHDRIIQIDFEKLDAGDRNIRTSLRLELTGRSANAYLSDADGNVLGAMFEQDRKSPPPKPPVVAFDPASLTTQLDESITQADVLDRFFGPGSPFGPQLKNEFLARCRDASPAVAFRSLVDSLFNSDPLPLIYSRLPLDQIQNTVINPRTDLILSHIELVQTRGMTRVQVATLSEAAAQYYSARNLGLALRAEYTGLRQILTREINKRESVMSAIESDRIRFEQPEKLKRYGDLILANLANARISGAKVAVIDYYDPEQQEIEIDLPEGATLKQAAADFFARYQKARRALEAIAAREREVAENLDPLRGLLLRIEQEPTASCVAEVSEAANRILGVRKGARPENNNRPRTKGGNVVGRRFKSSDGFEIVVGRNDRDNDTITFRVAKPNDVWLHAADYPGSHAIIRNPTREALPHRTITEAAELAAFYSQAKREGKAAVHYAQKKFVSKPPRSKPGLVRLSSFKTILVEPRCVIERLG